jgi:hypothetical protein
MHGAGVRATLLSAAGDVLATSETVTIHVDDHGAAPVQKAAITGLQPSYRDGDAVALTATVTPSSVLDRWEWYLQRPGSDTPALLSDTRTADLRFTATADLDGAAVFARLTYADGRAYVESAPVVLAVGAAQPGEPGEPGGPGDPGEPGGPGTGPTDPGTTEPAPRPSTAPPARTGDALAGTTAGGVTPSTATPRQGQVVTVALGAEHAGRWVAAWMFSTPALLGGDWVQADATGTIAVRIPADAPVGSHRIAVFAADGTLLGWTAVEVAAATGATPGDRLATTGTGPAPLLALTVLLLAAGAGAVVLSRRGRAGDARG